MRAIKRAFISVCLGLLTVWIGEAIGLTDWGVKEIALIALLFYLAVILVHRFRARAQAKSYFETHILYPKSRLPRSVCVQSISKYGDVETLAKSISEETLQSNRVLLIGETGSGKTTSAFFILRNLQESMRKSWNEFIKTNFYYALRPDVFYTKFLSEKTFGRIPILIEMAYFDGRPLIPFLEETARNHTSLAQFSFRTHPVRSDYNEIVSVNVSPHCIFILDGLDIALERHLFS